MKRGCIPPVSDGMRGLLGRGKRFYVPRYNIPLEDSVRALRAAGGVPVVAHLFKYRFDDAQRTALLAAAADALTVFGEKFGAYPYKTFSVVQTGFLQGGMEYPQLVIISDALVPEVYREAVIHATAHQWFYGLVGNDVSL